MCCVVIMLPLNQTSGWSRSVDGCLWQRLPLQCAADSKWLDCEAEPWIAVPLRWPWTGNNKYNNNNNKNIQHLTCGLTSFSALICFDNIMEPLNIYNVTQTQLLPLFCTVEMRGWRHCSAISVIEDTHFRSSVKLGVTITSNSDTKGGEKNCAATTSCNSYLPISACCQHVILKLFLDRNGSKLFFFKRTLNWYI